MFFAQPGELSDDELDPDEEMEEERPRQSAHHDAAAAAESSSKTNSSSAVSKEKDSNTTSSGSPIKTEVKEESCDDFYHLIYVNNTWYILLRLHQVIIYFNFTKKCLLGSLN